MDSMKNKDADEKRNATWLISFIGMWVPAYFCPNYCSAKRSKEEIKETQRILFRNQCIASLVCYIPSLVACMFIVNLDSDWNYNSDIILDNLEFNVWCCMVIFEGLISTFLSIRPISSDMVSCKSDINSPKDINSDFIRDGREEESSHLTRYNDMSKSISKRKRTTEPETTYKKQVVLLLWSWFVLVLALLPLLGGNLFLAFSPDVNVYSYVYFSMDTNHTIAIKTSLLSIEKLDEFKEKEPISGYSNRIEDMILKDNTFIDNLIVYPQDKVNYADNQILIMTVNDWEKRRQEKDSESIDIVGALLLDEDIYRPSSPLKDVTKVANEENSPIMYLIRDEDRVYVDNHITHSMPLDIVLDESMIPKPSWLCDLGDLGCLADNYNKGYVAGYQYLTEECYWGGKSCHEEGNIKRVQDYCSGPETTLCDLDGKGWDRDFKFLDKYKRRFRWSPIDYCALRVDDIESECDNKSPGWTNFLGNVTDEFPDMNIQEVRRRRYCSVKNQITGETECIFEEEDIKFCCQNPEKDCHGKELC